MPNTMQRLARRARNWEPSWRYFFNLGPTLQHRLHRAPLEPEAARVVATLNRDGVAVTDVHRLLRSSPCFDEMTAAVRDLILKGDVPVRKAGAAAPAGMPGGGEKSFLINLLGERPRLDITDVFVRFALQRSFLAIANEYIGMLTRLRHYNVWRTLVTPGDASSSQLWHRDRDDLHYVLKVFVNLSDVDAGAGPFTYAPGTHARGAVRSQPAALYSEGNTARSNDAQMSAVVPAANWVTSIGPRGTIVLADTRGYHKGGKATDKERLVYTCMFTSALAQEARGQELFERPEDIELPEGRAEAFALGANGR